MSLWKSGRLGLLPGLTAKLEVDYLKKMAADGLIICSTKLDSIDKRKVWMTATVCDGETGKECARAKALFVRPRWSKTLKSMLPFGR